MKPIIKWSGGKSQEYKFFEEYIPKNINRYIEPFAGGASVYFILEHKNSIINDINFELISLYKIVHNKKLREQFIKELEKLNLIREELNSFLEKDISFENTPNVKTDGRLKELIDKSIQDKIKRIQKIEEKENKTFTSFEIKEHLVTALQSGLYFYAREIYNQGNSSNLPYYIAHWYYVREFCYSSMFRFSKSGKFNVPYGGTSYNKKNFKQKIDYFLDEKLQALLEKTEINNTDFEILFKKYKNFDKDDFIFLDPPYDSEFSQYNKEQDFDLTEQIRLRDALLKVNCRFMVVIKKTDFISEIYSDNYFKIKTFDKKYLTNMRNRNSKDVEHLIITNYGEN